MSYVVEGTVWFHAQGTLVVLASDLRLIVFQPKPSSGAFTEGELVGVTIAVSDKKPKSEIVLDVFRNEAQNATEMPVLQGADSPA